MRNARGAGGRERHVRQPRRCQTSRDRRPQQAESADPANTAAPMSTIRVAPLRPVIGAQPTSRANARNDANDPKLSWPRFAVVLHLVQWGFGVEPPLQNNGPTAVEVFNARDRVGVEQ